MLGTQVQHTEKITKFSQLTASPVGVGVAKSMTVKVFELELSPSDAVEILKRVHPKQRKVNQARVDSMIATMRAGKWHEPPFTADSIAFDDSGMLVNGTHRMTALSKHDHSLRFIVLVGVKAPETMPLPECDNGMPRSGYFVEGKDRNNWGVANFFMELLSSDVKPRHAISEMYDMILPAMEALPRLGNIGRRQAPVRAGFCFYWLRADAIERTVIEEQWRAFSNLDVINFKPGVASLNKALIATVGKDRSFRVLQFAQTVYALEHIDTSAMIKRYPDKYRDMVRQYFADKI